MSLTVVTHMNGGVNECSIFLSLWSKWWAKSSWPSLFLPSAPLLLKGRADSSPWSQHNSPTAGIYHFRWCDSCRSRSPPTHITHNHNTNSYTPLAPSGEIGFIGLHRELWFPGAPHAVCRLRRFLNTVWLLTLHHYGGSEDHQPLAAAGDRGGLCSLQTLHTYWRGPV